MNIIGEIKDKSGFLIFLPKATSEKGNFVLIKEGAGDSLTKEDRMNGCIDYIDFTAFSFNAGCEDFEGKDGGQYLLKKWYSDMSEIDIINTVLEELGISNTEEVMVVDTDC